MKNLQLNNPTIGAQEYSLVDKASDDVYVYGAPPFYKYIYFQLDGVPKYFRTQVEVLLQSVAERGYPKVWYSFSPGSYSAINFSVRTQDPLGYILSEVDNRNPLTIPGIREFDLCMVSANVSHNFFVVASYNLENRQFEYNPRWRRYDGGGSATQDYYEIYLTDSADDLESTNDRITADSKIHSITSKLEDDGYYSLTINFMK